jgi:serine phosphatase RsbU (regulator of sigma subunit)
METSNSRKVELNTFKKINFRRAIKIKNRHVVQELKSKIKEDESSKKNKEINDSIIYAKRIQEAMMLKEKHLFRLFPKSFIMFKPKDIVSGDFYWFTKLENKIIIAVADCTGHGVPGAFMSVLGINLLNQIIIEEKNTDVSYILQRLDHKLNKVFDYTNDFLDDFTDPENRFYDGMDISICCIDYSSKTFTHAGAFSPLFHICSENKLNIYNGSRYPIGGMKIESARAYESSTGKFNIGDKIYLSSDGFQDQFGGNKNKKFMTKKFKSLLHETSNLEIKNQGIELENNLDNWMNENEQTDDILIIGVQL